MTGTSTLKMADAIFRARGQGYPLIDFIADRHDVGVAWAEIARQITDITDGVVDRAPDTIRRWYEAHQESAA